MSLSRVEFSEIADAFLEKEARTDSRRAARLRRSVELKLLIDGMEGARTGPLRRGTYGTFVHAPHIGNGEILRIFFEIVDDIAVVWALDLFVDDIFDDDEF